MPVHERLYDMGMKQITALEKDRKLVDKKETAGYFRPEINAVSSQLAALKREKLKKEFASVASHQQAAINICLGHENHNLKDGVGSITPPRGGNSGFLSVGSFSKSSSTNSSGIGSEDSSPSQKWSKRHNKPTTDEIPDSPGTVFDELSSLPY